jgi:hypothetical protein
MIERNEPIRFHEQGTLDAVTRWVSGHAEGIAEWLKNLRRQYQSDRADVAEADRVAAILLKDADRHGPARIGVLDVGGATLEDVTYWSTWDDPTASGRGSGAQEEQTQGNGGKAYMFRLFDGTARILGVKDNRRNCKGFEGPANTVDRGTPGWIPSLSEGRDVEVTSLDAELTLALAPYGLELDDLPATLLRSIRVRKAFTLVDGEQPTGLWKGKIDSEDIITKVLRHEQSTLCLEQVEIYALHNRRVFNGGRRLTLPVIPPYPELENPFVWTVPDELPLADGRQMIQTREGGTKEAGRLTLHTSREDMPNAWKNLRPRWQIAYRTKHQMIGAKPVSDFAATIPGSHFVYGTVELPALEPAYVEHGRRRPKSGPLVEALDLFITEKIREVARMISDRRRTELNERELDEVHLENRRLDEFKNRFLPSNGGTGGAEGEGPEGPKKPKSEGPERIPGSHPEEIELLVPEGGINIAAGLSLPLRSFLAVTVRDDVGRAVKCVVEWFTSDNATASVRDGLLQARERGNCEVWARVKGTEIETPHVPVRVWNIDHVLLTPRSVQIPLGTRQALVAEVTDDNGERSTDVLLEWKHDAEDQLTVLLGRTGTVTGNRLGRTSVTAGAGTVWARIPVDVHVIPNTADRTGRGGGFPRLLLTGKDEDPATGSTRQGDPDQPALWQEASDFERDIWWLNLQSPDARFAFERRAANPELWRAYHAEKVMEMVIEVWMREEYTKKAEAERAEIWVNHKAALERHQVQVAQQMWRALEGYVREGTAWQPDAEEVGV